MAYKKIKSVFIKEYEGYSKSDIFKKFGTDDDKAENIFNELIKHTIIVSEDKKFKFKYVGLIIIDNFIIKCYPKYIPNENNIYVDFKLALNAIKKYNRLHEDFTYQNEELEDISFNLLSLMLFFIEDYYENGVYTNTQNILEINGNGEINWDKTINGTYPLIKNNNPYYLELHTRYKKDDLYNFFRLLHECIITECSKDLEGVDLLNYFDLMPVELSDKDIDDFGDIDFILNKLEKELNVEFNTHKQKLLKSMYAYLSNKKSFNNKNFIKLYGTSTYHVIWENMCGNVFNNMLDKKFKELIEFNNKFANALKVLINSKKNYHLNSTLKKLIEKPKWVADDFDCEAEKTYIPDLITISKSNFSILDAKYYSLIFQKDNLKGQPGIESISKQYFYELAYRSFVDDLNSVSDINLKVKNAFLFPIYGSKIENKGYVELKMISSLNLQNIQIIMLPANEITEKYLKNEKWDISKLELDKYDSSENEDK